MPLNPTRDLVKKKVYDCFPDPTVAHEALAVLDTYGNETWQHEKERVQLGLLKTASEDLDHLCRATNGARSDYRNNLIPAEEYETSQASSKISPQERAVLAQHDLDDYQRWLTLSLACRELVLEKLIIVFPDPDAARRALAIVQTYGEECWHREKHRVHLALLRISQGDLVTLGHRTTQAQSDFRSVLVAAECGGSHETLIQLRDVDRREFTLQYENWLTSSGA